MVNKSNKTTNSNGIIYEQIQSYSKYKNILLNSKKEIIVDVLFKIYFYKNLITISKNKIHNELLWLGSTKKKQ